MDTLARSATEESLLVDDTVNRVIDTAIKRYIDINTKIAQPFTAEVREAVLNTLFLKYTGIEFEGIFQSIYVNKKLRGY